MSERLRRLVLGLAIAVACTPLLASTHGNTTSNIRLMGLRKSPMKVSEPAVGADKQAADTPHASAATQEHAPVVLSEVVFKEVKDTDALVKDYPFLKSFIEQMKKDDHATSRSSPVLIADMRSKTKKINLLLVRIEGAFNCGTEGCSTTIYADTGDGYKIALDAVVILPIFLSTGGSKVSLFFCTSSPEMARNVSGLPTGKTEWDLHGHSFVFSGPLHPDVPPSCD